jgi:hypothetical protein
MLASMPALTNCASKTGRPGDTDALATADHAHRHSNEPTTCLYLACSAAQVQVTCAAVALVPALLTAHILTSSLSHTTITFPCPSNLASLPLPLPLWPPLLWHHAVIGATHRTARFHCWRFWRHRNVKQLCGRNRVTTA